MSDSYHHGNLRQALIDAGIRIINEEGEGRLSLRKVAASCNVSHAAPYAHFKDKEELLDAIKNNVTDRFMSELKDSVKDSSNADEALVNMGKRYVDFFVKNPDYFKFLFSSQNITAHLGSDDENDYPPFLFLKEHYLKYLKEHGLKKTKKEKEIDLLQLWSSVHGLASIACMSGVEVSFDWEKEIPGDILIR